MISRPWRQLALGAVGALAAAAIGCTEAPTATPTQVSLSLTPDTTTLTSLGAQVQLQANVGVSAGDAPAPVWATRDVNIAAVGDHGMVRAVGNGTTWIVAQATVGDETARDSTQVVVSQVPASLQVTTSVDTLTWLGATTTLHAAAVDALGNPIEGMKVHWTSSDTKLATVDSAGTVTARKNGGVAIRASLGTIQALAQLTVSQQVASVTVSPDTATIAVGGTKQFSASATDAGGSTVSGVTFLWLSANPNVALVDTLGLATGTGVGTVTITAAGRGEPGNAVLTVGSSPTTATHMAFSSQPTNAVAGQALSPAVEIELRDAGGQVVTSARDAVTLAFANNAGSGTLSGTKTVTAVNGIASFSGLSIDKAAAGYTLMATASGLPNDTSSTFDIGPGAPAKLAFAQQPTSVEGNQAMSPAVTVTILDGLDNVTTGTDPVTVSLSTNPWKSIFGAGGTLSGTTTVSAVNGTATFSTLSVDKPGQGYTLRAVATGLQGDTSASFANHLTMQSISQGKGVWWYSLHGCGIATGGTYCWGANYYGELGGATGNTNTDSVAVLVQGGHDFTQVSAGDGFTCAIDTGGSAYCWGVNYEGELGDGSTGGPSAVPVAVSGGYTFSQISAGTRHACGLSGTDIYCWGADGYGELGDGDGTGATKTAPTLVSGSLAWQMVSVGGYHTCGVTTAGDLYCWGNDGNGQLGNDATFANQNVPVQEDSALTWKSVSAGGQHTCAVTQAGAGYCWGYNYYGQLGNGVTLPGASIGTPVPVNGGYTWAKISAGDSHTCGMTSTGVGYCWGYNNDGQSGGGSTGTGTNVPTAISGGLTLDDISAGTYSTCGLVGSSVYCWGYNAYGQLGLGNRQSQVSVPTQIVQ